MVWLLFFVCAAILWSSQKICFIKEFGAQTIRSKSAALDDRNVETTRNCECSSPLETNSSHSTQPHIQNKNNNSTSVKKVLFRSFLHLFLTHSFFFVDEHSMTLLNFASRPHSGVIEFDVMQYRFDDSMYLFRFDVACGKTLSALDRLMAGHNCVVDCRSSRQLSQQRRSIMQTNCRRWWNKRFGVIEMLSKFCVNLQKQC